MRRSLAVSRRSRRRYAIDFACGLPGQACGLTSRETELLHYLVTGAATRDKAGHMFVSEHTVQDHLKSIFAKTATPHTLLARSLGT